MSEMIENKWIVGKSNESQEMIIIIPLENSRRERRDEANRRKNPIVWAFSRIRGYFEALGLFIASKQQFNNLIISYIIFKICYFFLLVP